MTFLKPALTLLCASGILAAQAPIDLNGLVAAAAKYSNHGLQGEQRPPAALDLRLMRGDNDAQPAFLMVRATDVTRWTIFYNAEYPKPVPETIVLPRSASLKCVKGIFTDFLLSTPAVPDCKTMDNMWLPLPLDGAIAALNTSGYVRGFSQVEVKRPDLPGCPDGLVYVFTCPWERTRVAISCATGAVSWYQMY